MSSSERSIPLSFTDATGAQLVAAPTKDASGAAVGGVTAIVGFIIRNKSTANAITVILHNGVDATGDIISAMTLPAGTATSPTVQDQDYAKPRWSDKGIFIEKVGTSPTFSATVWIQ